ncbi:MAG: uroporphyrinogen decarboxylase family protein [Candidatus Bathyarchaeia archaeon]
MHLNEMLPPRLFERYYWPSLKEIVDTLVRKELLPLLFLEGDFTPFIRYLLELPKGKVLVQLEKIDLKKARNILEDHVVLMGCIHPSHYIVGEPEIVKREVKNLLEEVKQAGAFIFVGSSVGGIPDEARPENVKAAIDAVKEYGVY